MSEFIIHMTKEELVQIIRNAVNIEMNGQVKSNLVTTSKEISRKEAAKLLNVSVATIDNWSKRGILTKYARGSRRYFLEDELLKSKKEIIFNKK